MFTLIADIVLAMRPIRAILIRQYLYHTCESKRAEAYDKTGAAG